MIEEQISLFLDWKKTHASNQTIKSYRPWIKKFDDLIGKKIEEITFEDVIKFNVLLKEKYAPKSVQMGMSVLHNFLGFWKKRKDLKIILEDVRIPRTRANSHLALLPNDYVLILAQIDVKEFDGERDNAIIRTLYDTGVRIGELCSLNVEDVDLATRSAIIDTEKTNKTRRIFWGQDTNEFLRCYLLGRSEIVSGPERGLFINLSGGRLTTRSAERIIQKYCSMAQIKKKIVPHSFRHGKAHFILDNGGTVKDVQYILGHQSPISSFAYLQFNDAEQNKRALNFMRQIAV